MTIRKQRGKVYRTNKSGSEVGNDKEARLWVVRFSPRLLGPVPM